MNSKHVRKVQNHLTEVNYPCKVKVKTHGCYYNTLLKYPQLLYLDCNSDNDY